MSERTFGASIIAYYRDIAPDRELSNNVEWLNPFDDKEVNDAVEFFYEKYFSDHAKRTLILGINPGRFGAGITGIPFTDPIRLEDNCGIANNFQKRPELSSEFVYELIEAYGGPQSFYRDFYISSVSPLGFIRNGTNYNYYDSVAFFKKLKDYLTNHMEQHWKWPMHEGIVVNWGKGKNEDFIRRLYPDFEKGPFDELLSLPHPRWIMQYRRKKKEEWIGRFINRLSEAHRSNQQSSD